MKVALINLFCAHFAEPVTAEHLRKYQGIEIEGVR
jgi:hypothetical protein